MELQTRKHEAGADKEEEEEEEVDKKERDRKVKRWVCCNGQWFT